MAKEKVNFATYPQDYYTGAQVRIYFGSIWVDDIATISYQTSNSKVPLFGNSDHQFRSIAQGQFMVRGSFTIAFKQTGYLYSIIELARADQAGLKLVNPSRSSYVTYLNYISQGLTVEQALDFTSGKKSTQFVNNGKFASDSDFNDITNVLENTIWNNNTPDMRLPRSDELDYYENTGGNGALKDIDRDGFDILLTFGNYKAGNDSAEHTMISINDVHITGESLVVSPSAEAIGLTCEFFARAINERVSSAWPAGDQTIAKQNARKTGTSNIETPSDLTVGTGEVPNVTPDDTQSPEQQASGPEGVPDLSVAGRANTKEAYITFAKSMDAKYGLPAGTVAAIVQRETGHTSKGDFSGGWDPNIKNPTSSATGLGQFTTATAETYHINPKDPYASLDAIGRMITEAYKLYGDWDVAAIAHYPGTYYFKQRGFGQGTKLQDIWHLLTADQKDWIQDVQNYRKHFS